MFKRRRVIRASRNAIDAVEGVLPARDIHHAREFVDHNECGLAIELICTQLHEFDVVISPTALELIKAACELMELDADNWEILAVSGDGGDQ